MAVTKSQTKVWVADNMTFPSHSLLGKSDNYWASQICLGQGSALSHKTVAILHPARRETDTLLVYLIP